ncbi:MAG: hypothetical protein G01um101491_151, partial [Parcubacteria group bacterium Gr01-1014_91]
EYFDTSKTFETEVDDWLSYKEEEY